MLILSAIFNTSHILDEYWHNKIDNNYNYNATFNQTLVTPDTNWPSLLLVLFILSGVFGNSLVCIAVSTEKRLQNVTNYFLLSLSVADLLVCTLVMPFSILTVMNYGKWDLGFTLCAVHCYTDVLLCSASIVHMTAISLDRYLGISRPLKTRNKSKLVVFTKILIVWILTVVISCPLAVLFLHNPSNIFTKMTNESGVASDSDKYYYLCQINNRYYMIYGSTLAFLIPFGIMLITYLRTTNLLKRQAALLGAVARKSPNAATAYGHQDGLRRTRTRKRTSSARSRQMQRQMYSVDEDSLATTCSLYAEHQHAGASLTSNSLTVRHSISMEDAVTFSTPILSTYTTTSSSTPKRKLSPKLPPPETCSLLDGDVDANDRHHFATASNDKQQHTIRSRLRSLVKHRRVAGGVGGADFPANGHQSFSSTATTTANDVANEQKATRVLGLVFACFFVCWTPFFALNFTYAFCADYCQAPYLVETVFLWLGFVSSSINPIIYTVFNKKFRQAFARIVRCRWRRRYRHRNSNPYHHAGGGDALPMSTCCNNAAAGGLGSSRRSVTNNSQRCATPTPHKTHVDGDRRQKISLINKCGGGIAYAVQRTSSSATLTNGGLSASTTTERDGGEAYFFGGGTRHNFTNAPGRASISLIVP